MKIAIHQPNFLPWYGFFAKYQECDVFVNLNDCQFTKGGYTNRVNINGNLVSVHVRSKNDSNINEVVLNEHKKRIPKLVKLLSQNYTNLDQEFIVTIENFIKTELVYLHEFNSSLNEFITKKLNMGYKYIKSESLNIESTGSDRILDICKNLKASEYITGTGGMKYLDIDKFKHYNIKITCRNYGKLFHDTSIMDLIYD